MKLTATAYILWLINVPTVLGFTFSSSKAISSVEHVGFTAATTKRIKVDVDKPEWRGSQAELKKSQLWEVIFDCEQPIKEERQQISWHVDGQTIQGSDDTIGLSISENSSGSRMVFTNFTYALVNQYDCLRRKSESTKSNASLVSFTPVVKPEVGLDLDISDTRPSNATCMAPPGTPLFWILSPTAPRVTVQNFTEFGSSVTNVSFPIPACNSTLTFQCCAESKSSEPPNLINERCTNFTLIVGAPTIEEHNMDCSNPNKPCTSTCTFNGVSQSDAAKTTWEVCNSEKVCTPKKATSQAFIGDYTLLTTIETDFPSNNETVRCNATNSQGLTSYEFPMIANEMGPNLTSSTVGFRLESGKKFIIYTCTVKGIPLPRNIKWIKTYVNREMLQPEKMITEDITEAAILTPDVQQVTSTLKTRWWNTSADAATYACHSENEHGSVTSLPLFPKNNLVSNLAVKLLQEDVGAISTYAFNITCTVTGGFFQPEVKFALAAPNTIRHAAPPGSGSAYLRFDASTDNIPAFARCYYNDLMKTESWVTGLVFSRGAENFRHVSIGIIVGEVMLLIALKKYLY